jgi:thiol:disulfide interchange protein
MNRFAIIIPGLIFMLMLAAGLRFIFHTVIGKITGEGIRGMVLWQSDFNNALAQAAAQHKQVLIEFARDSSTNCHDLAKNAWSRFDIAGAATDYVPVMVDIAAHPDLATKYDIATVPSLVVIDAKSQTIIRDGRDRMFSPDELLLWLKPGSTPISKLATPQDGLFDRQKTQFDEQTSTYSP